MTPRDVNDIKQLLLDGKSKGCLDLDAVSRLLPPESLTSEQIDEVMSVLGDLEIDVVDGEEFAVVAGEALGDAAERDRAHAGLHCALMRRSSARSARSIAKPTTPMPIIPHITTAVARLLWPWTIR